MWVGGERSLWTGGDQHFRNKNEILAGQVSVGIGLLAASMWTELGKNAATISIAQQAAAKYNQGR